MMALGLGLCLGVGLFCSWWSCWQLPGRVAPHRPRRSRMREQLQDAGLADLSPAALLLSCACCGSVVFALGMVSTGVHAVAACFAVMSAATPWWLVRVRARRRRRAVRQVWPDAVDHLTSAVRAGLSLPEALAQLGERGPDELRPAFVAFAQDYRAGGRFDDALDGLKRRLADPVGDRIVESLRLARAVGGSDLGRLLRTLAAFLRDDARTRSELEGRQGWTVNGARLAVAAPWIVLLLLTTRPESVAAYDRPAGAAVLAFGGVVSAAAYLVMLRIARLPEERRVLR